MSRKYQVTIPEPISDQLQELAAAIGERASTLAGHFVCDGVARTAKNGKVRPLRQPSLVVGAARSGQRARWLDPWGGDAEWRAEMWAQIVVLHGRYPKALAWLQEGWWTDDQQAELLGALAIWRAEIDEAGVDPREELAFHAQLDHLSQTLRQAGGGVTKAWRPGAPPEAWIGE
jgi:hypothetical protein